MSRAYNDCENKMRKIFLKDFWIVIYNLKEAIIIKSFTMVNVADFHSSPRYISNTGQ